MPQAQMPGRLPPLPCPWYDERCMDDTVEITCPYCFERVEIYVDPDSRGELVRDCDVCCHPWTLHVSRDENGELRVEALRAQ